MIPIQVQQFYLMFCVVLYAAALPRTTTFAASHTHHLTPPNNLRKQQSNRDSPVFDSRALSAFTSDNSDLILVQTWSTDERIFLKLILQQNDTFSPQFETSYVQFKVSQSSTDSSETPQLLSTQNLIISASMDSSRAFLTVEIKIIGSVVDFIVSVSISKSNFSTNSGASLSSDFSTSICTGIILPTYPELTLTNEINVVQTSAFMKVARILPVYLLAFNSIQAISLLLLLDIYLPQRFYEICRFVSAFIFEGIRPWQPSLKTVLAEPLTDYSSITDIVTKSTLHISQIGIQESMLSDVVLPATGILFLLWIGYTVFERKSKLKESTLCLNIIAIYMKVMLITFMIVSFQQIRMVNSVSSVSRVISLLLAIAFLSYFLMTLLVIYRKMSPNHNSAATSQTVRLLLTPPTTKGFQVEISSPELEISEEAKTNYLEIRQATSWFFFGLNEERSLNASSNYIRYYPFYSTLYKCWIAFVLVFFQGAQIYQLSTLICGEVLMFWFRFRFDVLNTSKITQLFKLIARASFILLLVLCLVNHCLLDAYFDDIVVAAKNTDTSEGLAVPNSITAIDLTQIIILLFFGFLHTIIRSIQFTNHMIDYIREFHQYDSRNRALISKKKAQQIYKTFQELIENNKIKPAVDSSSYSSSSKHQSEQGTQQPQLQQVHQEEEQNKGTGTGAFQTEQSEINGIKSKKQIFPGLPISFSRFESAAKATGIATTTPTPNLKSIGKISSTNDPRQALQTGLSTENQLANSPSQPSPLVIREISNNLTKEQKFNLNDGSHTEKESMQKQQFNSQQQILPQKSNIKGVRKDSNVLGFDHSVRNSVNRESRARIDSFDDYSSVQRVLLEKDQNIQLSSKKEQKELASRQNSPKPKQQQKQKLPSIVEQHLKTPKKIEYLSSNLHASIIDSIELDRGLGNTSNEFLQASQPISILLRKEIIRKTKDPCDPTMFAFTNVIEYLQELSVTMNRVDTQYNTRTFAISAFNREKYDELLALFSNHKSNVLHIHTRIYLDLDCLHPIPCSIPFNEYPAFTHCFEV